MDVFLSGSSFSQQSHVSGVVDTETISANISDAVDTEEISVTICDTVIIVMDRGVKPQGMGVLGPLRPAAVVCI